MRGAVVPLVGSDRSVIGEVIANRGPGAAAIVGALNDLAAPTAPLRGVEAVRVRRRPGHVHDLPPAEIWAVDLPISALAIRREHERAFARSDQYPYLGHRDTSKCVSRRSAILSRAGRNGHSGIT